MVDLMILALMKNDKVNVLSIGGKLQDARLKSWAKRYFVHNGQNAFHAKREVLDAKRAKELKGCDAAFRPIANRH